MSLERLQETYSEVNETAWETQKSLRKESQQGSY